MGRIVGPFGVKGWVKVQPFTEEPDALCDYREWWIGTGDADRQATKVLESESHGATIVAQLEGIADREAAALMKGHEIAVPREALPAPAENEFYWADLIGFSVVNEQGEAIGELAGHFSNGAHDVMQVAQLKNEQNEKQERLIPFVDAVVRQVDVPGRRIVVDWGVDW